MINKHATLIFLVVSAVCVLWYFLTKNVWVEHRSESGELRVHSHSQVHTEKRPDGNSPDSIRANSKENNPEKGPDQSANSSLDSYLESNRKKMTPEIAAEIIARAKTEIPDLNHRRHLSSRIIAALCSNGYRDEAWKMIENGRGDVRAGQLNAFFKNDENVEACMPYLNDLIDPLDRSYAIGAMMNTLPAERLHEFDFSKIYVGSLQEKNAIFSMIELAAQSLSNGTGVDTSLEKRRQLTGQLLDTATMLARENKLDATQLARIMVADRSHDGFEDWLSIGNLTNALSGSKIEQLRSAVVSDMITGDARRAMDAILSSEKARISPLIISRALESWFLADAASASNWVTNDLPNVPDAFSRDVIAASLARTACLNGERDTAVQWMEKISNARLRSQVDIKIQGMKKETD